jgi:hypothetical protein
MKRAWLRPRNVVLVGTAAIVIWTSWAVTWALTAEPKPTIDYRVQIVALSAAAQPPGEDGWPYLAEAAGIAERLSASRLDDDFVAVYQGDASPEQVAAVRNALAELEAEGAFKLLASAGTCPRAVRPPSKGDQGPLFFRPLTDVGSLRCLGKACAAAMVLALVEHDFDRAVVAFDSLMVIACALSHQAGYIEQMVGHSVCLLTLRALHNRLVAQPVDAQPLRRVQESLRSRRLGEWALALEGERLVFLDAIQHMYSDDGRGDGRLLPRYATLLAMGIAPGSPVPEGQGLQRVPSRIENLAGFYLPSRKDMRGQATAYFNRMVARSQQSFQERRADPFDFYAYMNQLGPRYRFLTIMLSPNGDRLIDNASATKCELGGVRLMLAIECCRAETGALPTSLEALAPNWLDAIPPDPFSPGGFVYRLEAGTGPGRGYLLYTIGADGADDGGTSDPQEPERAFRPDAPGLDFVFNQPRAPRTEE